MPKKRENAKKNRCKNLKTDINKNGYTENIFVFHFYHIMCIDDIKIRRY
jgi:hypothetical protein